MAKLSAHGAELFRVEFSTYRLAYMSDGSILRDCGGGWKTYKKIKAGLDIRTHVESVRQHFAVVTPDRVCRAHFRETLAREFPCLETRIKVVTAIELMPDDPDGVWSTLEDYGTEADLDTVIKLCQTYKSAHAEGKAARAAKLSDSQPSNPKPVCYNSPMPMSTASM
jgi:hypothetical protein